MKKLFLASYFSGVANLLADFASGSYEGKKVAFIPTASIPEKVTFYVDADKKSLAKLGLIVDELEIAKASQDEIVGKLDNADYIFVEGGNTFFLLQELKRTGADKLIAEHISRGKIYIGASAGSMIAAKNIEYAKYMDNPEIAKDLNDDFSALGIVDFYIVPHYANFPFKKAAEKIINLYSDKLDLRPISNNQVVIVNGGKVETLTIEKKKNQK
ncbi:MAG: Type 1 glutamine amidotransferase-like domain-containing protein [Campylobacteraceae bacterium]|nr:Type 1 glutamine amidotransferase-like domain-containing protein [Campylobacteraceae bacterium]